MKAILAMLLCAIISLSYAAQMDVKVPGLSSITETDVRNGGREVSLKLQGDAWQRNFALFAPFVWIGVTSGSGVNQEPYGFTANKGSVLPAASIVMDQRKNDGSTLALLLQPSPFYDIVYDEIIYIAVPSNATVSGVAPNTQAFVIKAARSSLNGPAIVTEAMLRAGGLNMTILLLNGETFVSRGVQRDLSVLETIAQVTSNLFDLPEETNNFEVRKGLILKPIGFDIISPFDTMTVTFAADPMYNFYSPTEIVNFSLPKMFITSGLRPTPLAPLGFVVQNSPGTVYFHETVASPTGTGTIVQIAPTPSLTETEIRSGTAELVLVVLHDIWALADNTSAAVINKKTIFLQGFRSSDANGKFNNRMGSGFLLKSSGVQLIDLVPNPVTSEMRLRVKFEKDPQFILPANTAREMVTFFIPGEMFVSGISPQAQGGGVNSFQFSIEAMGHIQEFAARSALPIHSGYISGIIQRPVNLQLVVQLTKDKWKEAACKDVLRFGFSSNLPNLPHGFMRKLDTIVSPFGAQFQKCGSGAAELCLLTLPISTVSSFSLVPDAANTYPEPEIVTFKVPARCVGFGIQPSGGATFVIDVVPTQISYIAYMPGVDAGRPALTGTVYADRVFQIEAVYANTTAWNGIKLVNSLKCTSPDATQIEHTSIQKCSESNSCQTDAKKSKNAHSIEFKPKSGAFTFAGVWSICVMYDTEPFQLGTHLVIDTDPSATAGSEAAAPATAVDPTIVAVGGMFFLFMICGLSFVVWTIITKGKAEIDEKDRLSKELEEEAAEGKFDSHRRRITNGEEGQGHERLRSFTTGGLFFRDTEDEEWQDILEDEEIPMQAARFAFAEFGEADPRVDFLRDGMEGKTFNDNLESHKNRLEDMGMLDPEEEEEFEEEEDEEDEEEEEEEEDEGWGRQRRGDLFGDDDDDDDDDLRDVNLKF